MGSHVLSVLLASGSIPVDGDNLKNWLVHLAGNIFLALVVLRGAMAIWRARLLELVVLAALATVCAIFVYAPETFQGLGQALLGVIKG